MPLALALALLSHAAAADPDLLLEEEAGRTDALHVELPGRPLEARLRPLPPVPDKEPWAGAVGPPTGPSADHPGAATGALSGRAVYVSQCHGWKWYPSLGRFSTQRGVLFDTVEDFHNPEGTNHYLLRYLENAGARTFTVRERDWNPRMAISDNDGAGYAETGAGFEDGAAGFADTAPYVRGEDPFDQGTTRRFPADGGAVASWTPEVPADGQYAVYVSWDSDPANSRAAHYRITHPGGVLDRRFDQTVHGSTWQYVEHLWLPAGVGGLTVELVGDGEAGAWLSADAVRIGGGVDDIERFGETTGRPRWEASAMHYIQFNGAPESVYSPYGDDDADPSARSRWAAWEHPAGEDAVYLSWHSNAGGGTGTSTYVYDGAYTRTEGSLELGTLVQDELVEAIRAQWDADWTDRGVRTAAFSEVSPAYNDEMPSALVELAFHDLEADTALLKEPGFRRDAARAMFRGIVRYFAERDGEAPVFLPEPPVDVALLHGADGGLELSWSAGPAGDPFGDAATGYVVFRSADGRSWDGGTPVGAETTVAVDAAPGEVVYARVAAVNAGGLSFPTEVVGARRSPAGQAEVLVVLGFDRLRASNLLWEDAGPIGEVRRLDQPGINGFDGVVAHGEAVADAGWYFESAADERLAGLDLPARSRVVFWNAGEESTEDDTIPAEHQAQLAAFHAAGGALWVTGSEVLWDLDYRGSEVDQAFAADVLGATMAEDDAGTWQATGEGPLEGILLDFGPEDGAPYPAEWPDVLDSTDAAVARYATGGVAATLGDGRSLWGMPFECVGSPVARAAVAEALLPELVPGYTPPDPDEGGSDGSDGADGADGADGGVDSGLPEEPRGSRTPGPTGCGCAAGGAGGGLWGLVALVALVRRQRTRAKCQTSAVPPSGRPSSRQARKL